MADPAGYSPTTLHHGARKGNRRSLTIPTRQPAVKRYYSLRQLETLMRRLGLVPASELLR